jgi:hypothetical protein
MMSKVPERHGLKDMCFIYLSCQCLYIMFATCRVGFIVCEANQDIVHRPTIMQLG